MANAFKDFSTVANNNTSVGSANVAENCPASGINNAIRQELAYEVDYFLNAGTLASASTTDLGTIDQQYVTITGTTTITALGTPTNKPEYICKFEGILTLTHNATSLILPGGANITSAAGDIARFRHEGSGNWRCTDYQRASGLPIVSPSPAREALAGNRTYYVRTDGSDSNTGLVNDAAGAWLTLQKAWDTIQDTLDLAGYVVTVQVGDGTYTGPLSAKGKCVGQENQDSIVFQGNSGTPTNVIVNATSPSSGATIFSGGGAAFTIKDMRIRSTTTGDGLVANMGSTIYFSGLDFGACAGAHIAAAQQSFILASGNYTISGAATRHWQAQFSGSLIFVSGRTVTISGTPAFSTAFATSAELSDISCSSMTFTGSATGTRYSVILNAVISTAGGGATYLPGDVGGSSATGGQYA